LENHESCSAQDHTLTCHAIEPDSNCCSSDVHHASVSPVGRRRRRCCWRWLGNRGQALAQQAGRCALSALWGGAAAAAAAAGWAAEARHVKHESSRQANPLQLIDNHHSLAVGNFKQRLPRSAPRLQAGGSSSSSSGSSGSSQQQQWQQSTAAVAAVNSSSGSSQQQQWQRSAVTAVAAAVALRTCLATANSQSRGRWQQPETYKTSNAFTTALLKLLATHPPLASRSDRIKRNP
jgi:hypothetical protein